MRRKEFNYFVIYWNEATNMKLFITIIISLIVISFTAQSAKLKSLIVAEYKEETQKKYGYTYLVSYNFLDGKLISNDTIFGPAVWKDDGLERSKSFVHGTNFIYKNRFAISTEGIVIDLKARMLVYNQSDDPDDYIGPMGDTLIFYRYNKGKGPEYLFLNLLTKDYTIERKEKDGTVDGLISPNFAHSLLVDECESKSLYITCIFDCFNNNEVIVKDCGHGTLTSTNSSFAPHVQMFWLDDTNFVYAHVKNELVEIKKVNIFTKAIEEIIKFESVPEAITNAEFLQDGNGNLLFVCEKGTFQIDLENKNIFPITYKQLGNKFEIKIKPGNKGYTVKYNNKIIDKNCSNPFNARTSEEYFAMDFGIRYDKFNEPKGIKIWNNITKEWTIINVPSLIAIIGWIE